jgi:hypothetical protein
MLLSTLLAATEEPAPLIAEPWVFAAIAAAIFLSLALVSWSYRDVAHRHNDKTSGADGRGHGHH